MPPPRRTGYALPLVLLLPFVSTCEGPDLVISPAILDSAVEGAFFQKLLDADSDGAPRWRVTAGTLPPGLELNEDTGALSGTPTQPGTFEFVVAADEDGFVFRTGERMYSLTVIPRLVLDATLPVARQNEPYHAQLQVEGGVAPYVFDMIGLPAGIAFDEDTGELAGMPVQPEPGRLVRFSVTDSGDPQQSATQDAPFVVKPPAVMITTTMLPGGEVGVPYSEEVEAEGGFDPRTWTIIAGVLPDGLSLPDNRRTGLISGMPTTAGSFTFTIEVEDDDDPPTVDSHEFTIDIAP